MCCGNFQVITIFAVICDKTAHKFGEINSKLDLCLNYILTCMQRLGKCWPGNGSIATSLGHILFIIWQKRFSLFKLISLFLPSFASCLQFCYSNSIFPFVSHCSATFSRKMKARDGIAATWKIESEKLRPKAEPKSIRRKTNKTRWNRARLSHFYFLINFFAVAGLCTRAFISNFCSILSKNSISRKRT